MKTVVKAVTLLKRFSSQKTEWGLSELARATGIDKVIVYRLLGWTPWVGVLLRAMDGLRRPLRC